MNERADLAALLERSGVESALAQRLGAYGALLLNANRRVNLTGAATPDELADHIVDSLTLVPHVVAPLVDVGSGGGLPAIPVALATGIHVTLVESTTKKAAFLEAALAELGLTGRVIPQRAEQAARDPDLRDAFATGTARAVSSAPTVMELVLPFIRPGGTALLQRGKMEERERRAATDAAPMLGARLEPEIPLAGDRRLFVVRKTGSTPNRFPRRTGVPEKRPLCY